jgi:hypothetical protein
VRCGVEARCGRHQGVEGKSNKRVPLVSDPVQRKSGPEVCAAQSRGTGWAGT